MPVPVFYVPSLLPAGLSPAVPVQTAFFPVGLAANPDSPGERGMSEEIRRAREAVRRALPLGPEEAKAALDDLLRMGEEFSQGGLLKELAAHQILKRRGEARQGKTGEFADLARFAETGELPSEESSLRMPDWSAYGMEAAATAEDIRQAVVDCQKTLLLAFSLEERQQELTRLEEKYLAVERSLLASLGEGHEDGRAEASPKEAGLSGGKAPESTGNSLPSLSWRTVVDAVLPFLPEKGVLFTADARMAEDLREAGMLQPFPEDRAFICEGWPQALVSGLLFVSVPAWRLVGRRGPDPERPWLRREVEIFVARPPEGWVGP